MSGTELSAKFYEARGREVELRKVPARVTSGHRMQWCFVSANLTRHAVHAWKPVPDLTQPGHLETVIGMVRERWPDCDWDLICRKGEVTAHLFTTNPIDWDSGIDPNPAKALMLAACRAGGVAVD